MLSLLKAIFFSKLILLTSSAIDIDDSMEIHFQEPVSAITERARIKIDVKSMLPIKSRFNDKSVTSLFPKGCISVQMFDLNDRQTIFTSFEGVSPSSSGSVYLMLYHDGSVSTDTKFNRMEIHTTCPLRNVKIYWDNAGGI